MRRNNAIANLLPSMKALTEQLHAVLLGGGLVDDEYAHLNSLQIWVGRLVAEQDASRGGKAPRTRKK